MSTRAFVVAVVLALTLACMHSPSHPWPRGRGTGWRCRARASTWAYVSSCDRHERYIDNPPLADRIAPCDAPPTPSHFVEVEVAACFHYRVDSTEQTVCSARMDDCVATRNRLVTSPRTFFWFSRALLDVPEKACIHPDESVSDASVHLGEVGACGFWD